MARKHPRPAMLSRSSLVSIVEFAARKLIIFVLVQLVLSPFILITADSFSGSTNNNKASAVHSQQRFGSASNENDNTKVNRIKTNCTADGFLMVTFPLNATQGTKTVSKNSISKQSVIGENRDGPYADDLSLTENASIYNQSRRTITASDSQRTNREDESFNKDGERVLSRKRRYLIFPPGSSLQIVYDTYYPIVDYTNLVYLGVTAAMAWELPSKPIYLDEELRDSYEMEQLPPLQRYDKNVTNAQYVLPSKKYSNVPNGIKSNFYYTNIPEKTMYYQKNQYQSPYKSYYPPNYKSAYSAQNHPTDATNKLQYYVSYADRMVKQFQKLTEKIPQDRPLNTKDFQEFANILKNVKTERKSNSRYAQRKNYNHFIRPVFRKRSTNELTPIEKFDLNLHRNSRHSLYKQINTFLKTQGSDGSECILKMLCETGQRKHNAAPGSMVIELLRTVFTLPEPIEPAQHSQHQQYDEAHASAADCQQQYPKCKESVWNSKYM